MDLVVGPRRVIALTEHNAKTVDEYTLPLTGKGIMHRIITNLAVFDITPAGLQLVAMPDDGVATLHTRTGTPSWRVHGP